MKKVVMILSITMISLATIEGADTPQFDDENEIKSFLAVSVNKVSDQPDGAERAPHSENGSEIPVQIKFKRGRVQSMELSTAGTLVPSRRSAQDIFKLLTGQLSSEDKQK